MTSTDGEWKMRARSKDKGKSVAGVPRSRSSSIGKKVPKTASMDRQRARSSVMTPVGAGKGKVDFKAEKQKNIHELLQRLTELKCVDRVYTLKEMQCPTSAVFLTIYSSLLEVLSGQPIQWIGKPEDEIPGQIKMLGYPYQVTKSMIVSIAPHTWPQLLNALVWLCQQITQIMAEPITCVQNPYFMEQANIFKGEKETDIDEMLDGVRSANDPLKDQLAHQLLELDKAKESLDKSETACQYWAIEVEQHEARIASLNKYIEEMGRYMVNFELRQTDLHKNVAAAEKLLAEKQSVLQQSELKFAQENLSVEEMEVVKREIEELCAEKESLDKEEGEADRRIWRLEIDETRLQDELCKHVKEANSLLTKWPAEDGSIVSISLASPIPLQTQYIDIIRPVIEYYHTKLHDPDQMRESNQKLRARIEQYREELTNLKKKLCEKKEKFIEFLNTKADDLETRYERQEQTIRKWNNFQIDFYRRKQQQLAALQRQKRALDDLKSDAAFSLRMLKFIENNQKIGELKSKWESWKKESENF